MALASYGTPRFLPLLRELVHATDDGGFPVERIDWAALAKARTGRRRDDRRARRPGRQRAGPARGGAARPGPLDVRRGRRPDDPDHGRRHRAQLRGQRPDRRRGPVRAGLGAARRRRLRHRARAPPCTSPARPGRSPPIAGADLGRGWTDDELEAELQRAALPYTRPDSIAAEAARVLAGNGIVAWYQGRSEYGPRALGHRSLLAHPGDADTQTRMNDVKGREQFRPIAPMVRAERFADIFDGVYPSPYMLFVHRVRPEWTDRIPAVVHVDGTARVQTVHAETGAAGGRDAGRVRAAHRPAGGGQHLAEHGRPADGGHPARGDGAVRLGAGRPARARPVRGAPRHRLRRRRR